MPDLLTVPQAADRIGITRQAVWLTIRDGRLKGQKVREIRGWVWYIEREELERWMRERTAPPTRGGGRQ